MSSRVGEATAHMRKALQYPLVGLGLVLGACGSKVAPEPEIRPVVARTVAPGGVGEAIEYTGEIRSRYESDLGFRIGGKLVVRAVDVGAQVTKGTLLAQLDPGDQQLAVQSAQSAVLAARAELERARSDEVRYRDLLERGLTSRSSFIAQQTAAKTAQSRLEQALADLKLRQQQVSYTVLRADAPGVITRTMADVGTVVAAGQAVVTLSQASELEAVADVAEGQLATVRNSARVQVALLSARGQPVPAQIREIAPSADPVTRTYRVKCAIPHPPVELKLGMNVAVTFERANDTAGLVLPASALIQSGVAPAVWIIGPDDRVSLRSITVARYESDEIVVSAGLKPGERIVTAGVHKLVAGQQVRVLSAGLK